MKLSKNRSQALVVIVFYKGFTAALLAFTSIALFFSLRNYENLANFSEDFALAGKFYLIKWILEKLSNLNPRTLEFSSIVTGVYSIVTTIEAVGLWYQKKWANLLVLALVGLSIPPEIYELIRGFSLLKIVLFIVNLAVFWYLLGHTLDR